MNKLPQRSPTPAWQFVVAGLLGTAVIAGVGYHFHLTEAYVIAVAMAATFIFLGFVVQTVNRIVQIKDESEEIKFAAKQQSTTLRVLQFFAIPAFIVGGIMTYDLFVAAPVQDTGVVVDKRISSGRSQDHYLQIKGKQTYTKAVPGWFYAECSINDTVQVSLTPLFLDWHRASLIRDGVVAASTTPNDTYVMTAIVFGSFLPILLLVRPVREFFGKNSPVPHKEKIVGAYFAIVILCEILGVGFSIKLLAVFLGFCDQV